MSSGSVVDEKRRLQGKLTASEVAGVVGGSLPKPPRPGRYVGPLTGAGIFALDTLSIRRKNFEIFV